MKIDGRMWTYTVYVFGAGTNFSSALFDAIHRDGIGMLIAATSCAAMIALANWSRTSPRFGESHSKDAAK